MDYPKSMANIGLVDGKFVDENTVIGQVGSLIPSVWGNAVTDEILNVMAAGGEVPTEAKHDQMKTAIAQMIKDAQPVAVIVPLTISTVLTKSQMGLLLLDATAGAMTITLPAANAALGIVDVIVRRTDNTVNRLVVQAPGTDKIKFHTHLNASGYPFLVLMGAGDWWRLRSDGVGGWWPVGRYDSAPLGRPVFETTMLFSPGGYGALNGPVLNRAEWPWLWDHAQQSSMLVAEAARVGREGGWTSGDGALTFRGPEARGDFLRVLDEGRGVDVGRVMGSTQGDAIRNITGGASALYRSGSLVVSGAMGMTAYGSSPAKIGVVGADPGDNSTINFDASRVVPTASENRPVNIAYPGRIKLI